MKINKKVKIVLLSVPVIIVLFFGILVYHITHVRPIDNATVQISRIDFDKPFDSLSTIQITKTIKTIPGVKSQVIVKRNVVVYFHDNRIADSKKVFDQLMKKGPYKAQRFILDPRMASTEVCPVMNPDGLSYKFTKLVQRIF